MVDFQSRDTRRGPTDGEDDETGEGETGDNEESAAVDTDTEASTSEPSEAADTAAGNDDVAASEGDGTEPAAVADTTGDSDQTAAEPETDSAVTERIDEAAEQSRDSQPTDDTQNTERVDDSRQEPHDEPHPETQATTRPTETPQGETAPTTQTVTQSDASQEQSVAVAVVTVGTTTEEGDPTGEAVETALEAAGQDVTARERLQGGYDSIQGAVDRLVGRDDVEVVVTAGGLGVAPSEQTLEAVHPLFEKALPGFEEVYRGLLFEQQGTGVITVRATAGIAGGTPVFCLPADPAAARIAIDEIIAAEAGNLVAELP
ncbi:molybdenum cofactor biosynthesis protein MoaB [Haloarcula sp. CBA1130]|uniref:molybdopterin-binding protein n=1 Tax=unclassified Haloarcula TaxID=2624677 RepID=UPI001245D3FD|nr:MULTISPECIES: molybdopterin-binding protein [unclassified Haloarcula]KAA9398795.1 molybdenum cofactor biosynthesis protein MoaB [Haloarcula sp. CBA1129]KAA9403310.1 molybdenum cofactor biosynthesis protein MoaB [Haloarcula sp. CBA1130]